LILTDYHIHTELCGHARGKMESYVEKAILRGLKEIGFSDHAPCKDGFDPSHRMEMHEFENYILQIERLRESYPELSIKAGIEADIYPGFEESLLFLKESYPIDYVIGSVHYVNDYFVFDKNPVNVTKEKREKIIRGYFNLLNFGVSSGLINIIGHFDVVKWNFMDVKDCILSEAYLFLEDVARKYPHVMIELNTSGYRRQTKEPFPGKEIIESASENNIPVVIGSDAHRPEHVGLNFDSAEKLLSDSGYDLCEPKMSDLFFYCRS